MKYVLYILLFLIIGEIIFQIDYRIGIKEIKFQQTNIIPKPVTSKNKIFLLGDSFTQGYGVPAQLRIANQISCNNFSVADSCFGGANFADYIRIIKNLSRELKGNDIIVIGVNWNDILFEKHAISDILSLDSTKHISENSSIEKETGNVSKFASSVEWFYVHSKLLNFLLPNISNTLKRNGIPLPIGLFHYYRKIAYKDKENLIQLEKGIHFIDSINIQYKTTAILYLMPDFNLTKRIGYFNDYVNYFEGKSNYKTIHIINGVKNFYNTPDGYYCISIHDGHPNGLAHVEIAKQIQIELNKHCRN